MNGRIATRRLWDGRTTRGARRAARTAEDSGGVDVGWSSPAGGIERRFWAARRDVSRTTPLLVSSAAGRPSTLRSPDRNEEAARPRLPRSRLVRVRPGSRADRLPRPAGRRPAGWNSGRGDDKVYFYPPARPPRPAPRPSSSACRPPPRSEPAGGARVARRAARGVERGRRAGGADGRRRARVGLSLRADRRGAARPGRIERGLDAPHRGRARGRDPARDLHRPVRRRVPAAGARVPGVPRRHDGDRPPAGTTRRPAVTRSTTATTTSRSSRTSGTSRPSRRAASARTGSPGTSRRARSSAAATSSATASSPASGPTPGRPCDGRSSASRTGVSSSTATRTSRSSTDAPGCGSRASTSRRATSTPPLRPRSGRAGSSGRTLSSSTRTARSGPRSFVGHFRSVRTYDVDPADAIAIPRDFGSTESESTSNYGGYRITPGRLELAYADGHVESFTFFYRSDEVAGDHPTRLLIDGEGFQEP